MSAAGLYYAMSGTMLTTVDLSVQVLIPQTVYEYASSFVPVDTTRASRHRKDVLDTLRQLLPHSHTLVDQLNNGQHITSTL